MRDVLWSDRTWCLLAMKPPWNEVEPKSFTVFRGSLVPEPHAVVLARNLTPLSNVSMFHLLSGQRFPTDGCHNIQRTQIHKLISHCTFCATHTASSLRTCELNNLCGTQEHECHAEKMSQCVHAQRAQKSRGCLLPDRWVRSLETKVAL